MDNLERHLQDIYIRSMVKPFLVTAICMEMDLIVRCNYLGPDTKLDDNYLGEDEEP
jgi:hypothetical protein